MPYKSFCISLFIFLTLISCAGTNFHANEKISATLNTNSKILVLGLKLTGNISSAEVQLISNDKKVKGYGRLIKGRKPDDNNFNNKHLSYPQVYTGDGDRAYLVFTLPDNINDLENRKFLIYVYKIIFQGIRPVQNPTVPGSFYGTDKVSRRTGWWEPYQYELVGNSKYLYFHPLGYSEDPNFSFSGCQFKINNPGIYYLGEMKVFANLTFLENQPDKNISSLNVSNSQNISTGEIKGSIQLYSDKENFKKFLISNNFKENKYYDFSDKCKNIEQKEYKTF